MTPRQLLALLTLAALWGGGFLFIRVGAPALGPVVLIEARMALASAVLLAVAAARGGLPAPGAGVGAYLLLGAVNAALPFLLGAAAMLVLPASVGATLNATTPLFGAVVAALWLGEPLGARKLGALVVGLVGVALLMGLGPLPLDGRTALAACGSLGAAGLYGVGAAYTRKRFAGASPMALATYSSLAAAALLAPIAPFFLPGRWPTPAEAACVAGLALGATAGGYLLYFWLIQAVGAVRATMVTYLVPAFSIVFGVLFLHEAVTPGMLAGFALVAGSVALASRQG